MMREDWVECKIADLGKVYSGGTPRTTEPDYWGADVAWISPSDLTGYNSKYISKGKKSLSQLGLEQSSAKLLPKGSILYSSRAPIGYTVISENSLATNQGFKSLHPSKYVFNEYVYHYFKSMKQMAERAASGTTFKELSAKAFSDLPIPLPPLPEQRAIVEKIETLFSELDHGIANLRQAQQQLKTYRQAVLKKAFEGELTRDWREKQKDLPTAEQLLDQITEARKDYYAAALSTWKQEVKEWEAAGKEGKKPKKPKIYSSSLPEDHSDNPRQYDIPNIRLSTVIDSPTYGTSKKCYPEPNGIPVLRIPNIGNGRVLKNDLKYATFSEEEKAYYALHEGDILLIRSNGSIKIVGKAALIQKKDTEFLYAGYLIRIRPLADIVESQYLLYALSSTSLRTQIESKAKSTSGVNNINSGEIGDLMLPFFSVAEQKQIVAEIEERLSAAEALEQSLARELAQAEALRQSILKKAFAGELLSPAEQAACRRAADWEPATVLLERIRAEKASRQAAKTRRGKTQKTTTS